MIKKLITHRTSFMQDMGLDISDPSLQETPNRVAKMYVNELCKGLYEKPPIITTFPNDNGYNDMVLVKNIEVQSLCEHHFLPFIGICHIAYYPNEKVIGLSKFARVVDHFSRRPQTQERLTTSIYDYFSTILATEDIAVYIESEHFCMKLRGAKEHCAMTVTKKMGGKFQHKEIKDEFYSFMQ